jgi:tryptophan-rich sensory protein
MLFWWSALGVVLAVIYMVSYVLLRASDDGRRWYQRLRRPERR